jgi:DNA-binding IclR family transcriptional regulator
VPSRSQQPVLSVHAAACLKALKSGRTTKTGIAIEAQFGLDETNAGLDELTGSGLVERKHKRSWRLTAEGKKFRSRHLPEERRCGTAASPAQQRLLDVLDCPMRGRDIAQKMGVTNSLVHSYLVSLQARGLVRFGDPDRMMLIVAPIDNEMPLLTSDEARLLSALRSDGPTSVAKLKSHIKLSEMKTRHILDRLLSFDLVKGSSGREGETLFGLTEAGLSHPQRKQDARRAGASSPRASLPFRSYRVVAVLSAIQRVGAMRITDISDELQLPQQSTNALIQYLKRRKMIQNTGAYRSPYSLTPAGHATLAELTRLAA